MTAERVSAERVFGAMGTTVHLIGVGTRAGKLLEAAEARIHVLEARWSRFRATSELCRLNGRAGTRTTLTRETYDLVAAAVDGWHRTAGLFDPTLLAAVERAGYDRSFEQLPADRPAATSDTSTAWVPNAGCAGIELDPEARTVLLPAGTRFDLGGIAKGHAADLVVSDLADGGLDGGCANLGGDVRVWGDAPDGGPWRVDIADPTCETAPIALLEIEDGALVTSTRLRRRWLVDGVERHHLIDPRTRRSAFRGWAQVSVVAATATEAEVLVKAVFLSGCRDLLDACAARAVLVADDGRVETVGFDD
jgi:thiamine biosynthesis lipoprotein